MVYNGIVDYEWDEAKRAETLARRGLDFASVILFEWNTAITRRSDRHGEIRFMATGYIGDRLHIVIYTMRASRCRIISLRYASRSEVREYAES
jgi:uncharacterized DUF497 family protein